MTKLSGRNCRAGGETLKCFVRGVSQDKMMGFELIVWIAIQGYLSHVLLGAVFREEFVCYQERANEHDRHTVAVYEDGDSNAVLGDLPKEFSQVAFFAF